MTPFYHSPDGARLGSHHAFGDAVVSRKYNCSGSHILHFRARAAFILYVIWERIAKRGFSLAMHFLKHGFEITGNLVPKRVLRPQGYALLLFAGLNNIVGTQLQL